MLKRITMVALTDRHAWRFNPGKLDGTAAGNGTDGRLSHIRLVDPNTLQFLLPFAFQSHESCCCTINAQVPKRLLSFLSRPLGPIAGENPRPHRTFEGTAAGPASNKQRRWQVGYGTSTCITQIVRDRAAKWARGGIFCGGLAGT